MAKPILIHRRKVVTTTTLIFLLHGERNKTSNSNSKRTILRSSWRQKCMP